MKLAPRRHQEYLEGSYEPSVQQLLHKHLTKGGVFYDVGAHIGFFTLIAARIVGHHGKVFAFEAAGENVATLTAHIQRNTLTQVEVIPFAVWSEPGHLAFGQPYAGAPAGAVLRTAPDSSPRKELYTEVPATTLDLFADHHLPPTLIKIDVEGAEAEVLKGATAVIERHRPVIICEVHHHRAAIDVQRWLREREYSSHSIQEQHIFPRHIVATSDMDRARLPQDTSNSFSLASVRAEP